VKFPAGQILSHWKRKESRGRKDLVGGGSATEKKFGPQRYLPEVPKLASERVGGVRTAVKGPSIHRPGGCKCTEGIPERRLYKNAEKSVPIGGEKRRRRGKTGAVKIQNTTREEHAGGGAKGSWVGHLGRWGGRRSKGGGVKKSRES